MPLDDGDPKLANKCGISRTWTSAEKAPRSRLTDHRSACGRPMVGRVDKGNAISPSWPSWPSWPLLADQQDGDWRAALSNSIKAETSRAKELAASWDYAIMPICVQAERRLGRVSSLRWTARLVSISALTMAEREGDGGGRALE